MTSTVTSIHIPRVTNTSNTNGVDTIYKQLTGIDNPRSGNVSKENPHTNAATAAALDRFTQRDTAVRKIQRCWRMYRMSRTFRWLRYMLYRTERMLTHQVLRRLSPLEGNLLNDPCLRAKVRFRLGGMKFPPKIYYKIYTSGVGPASSSSSWASAGNVSTSVQYFSGYQLISPGSKAAEDSFSIMGPRSFHEKILLPDLLSSHSSSSSSNPNNHKQKIHMAYEVTDKQEYIRYLNGLDSREAGGGGRCNNWRELKLTQSMIQGVLLDERRNPSQDTHDAKQRNALQHAFELVERYSSKKPAPIKKPGNADVSRQLRISKSDGGGNGNNNNTVEVVVEDDFGMLFDWAQHLDEDELKDFEIAID